MVARSGCDKRFGAGSCTHCQLQAKKKKLCIWAPHCERPRRACALQSASAAKRQRHSRPNSQPRFHIATRWQAHELIPVPSTNEEPPALFQAWPGPHASGPTAQWRAHCHLAPFHAPISGASDLHTPLRGHDCIWECGCCGIMSCTLISTST